MVIPLDVIVVFRREQGLLEASYLVADGSLMVCWIF
jgi:hypothetical protein